MHRARVSSSFEVPGWTSLIGKKSDVYDVSIDDRFRRRLRCGAFELDLYYLHWEHVHG
jgi:hypothetical protein